MKRWFFSGVFQLACSIFLLICFMGLILPDNSFSEEKPAMKILPSCVVHKALSPLKIDGKLDEECWKKAPKMEFLGIADGSVPPWNFYGKMLWDDEYFYIGFYIEDPNIWASLDPKLPEPTAWPEQHEEFVMHNDGFAKIFFDPDGDGKTYAELHINARNKVDDWYFVDPRHWVNGVDAFHKQPDNWHLEFDYKDFRSAIYVDGTVNNPKDIDRYWTLEVAFTWDSLKPITHGNCPPQPGDVWRAHIGRVMCNAPKARHTYYTWPVIGVVDCHRPHQWGYIIFANEYKEIVY